MNSSGSYAVSADGKKLSIWGNDTLTIWNLLKGTQVLTYSISGAGVGKHCWLTEKHLLLGNLVVDATNGYVIWKYDKQGLVNNETEWGGGYWFLSQQGKDDTILSAVKIPHKQALEEASNVPESKRFLLRSGSPVALVVDSSVDRDRDKITKAVSENLTANGWKIVKSAPVTVTVSIKNEKTETHTFREIGIGRNEESVTITPKTGLVKFQWNGKTIWSRYNTFGGVGIGIIHYDSSQGTLQNYFDKNKERIYDWFKDVKPPKNILNPDVYGTSRISKDGILQ